MSKYFDRAAKPQRNAPHNDIDPQQFFGGIAEQARQIQQQNSGAVGQAQQYAQNLLSTGKISQEQYNRAWNMAQQIAAHFGRR